MQEYVWLIRGERDGRTHEHKYTGTLAEFLKYFESLLTLWPETTYTIGRE